LGAFADDVELSFEGHLIRKLCTALDENLPHARLGMARSVSKRTVIRWHIAPADERLAFFGDDFFKKLFTLRALFGVRREKDEARAILAWTRKFEADLLAGLREKGVRHLDEDTSAVPRVGFATASPPMIEVHQDLQPLLDDLMGLASLDIDDEANAAGVVFELRIVKTLFWGQASQWQASFGLDGIVGHFREGDVITVCKLFEYKFS